MIIFYNSSICCDTLKKMVAFLHDEKAMFLTGEDFPPQTFAAEKNIF